MDFLDSDGISQKETPWGQYCIMGRKTYEYSSAIKELQTALAKEKKIELSAIKREREIHVI